jgi:hypothetical protein
MVSKPFSYVGRQSKDKFWEKMLAPKDVGSEEKCSRLSHVLETMMIRRTLSFYVPLKVCRMTGKDIPLSHRKVIQFSFTPPEQAAYDEYSQPHKTGLFMLSQ